MHALMSNVYDYNKSLVNKSQWFILYRIRCTGLCAYFIASISHSHTPQNQVNVYCISI